MMLISPALAAEAVRGPAIDLFPVPLSTTWLWTQVLFLLIPAVLVIGGIWYLWRLLRALERMAEGLNKQR
ncbi:MAG: hypothetical protein JWN15_1753 [Firmicutes bacterium]|nr:hypothetical protein [Bacillota bacterium]